MAHQSRLITPRCQALRDPLISPSAAPLRDRARLPCSPGCQGESASLAFVLISGVWRGKEDALGNGVRVCVRERERVKLAELRRCAHRLPGQFRQQRDGPSAQILGEAGIEIQGQGMKREKKNLELLQSGMRWKEVGLPSTAACIISL